MNHNSLKVMASFLFFAITIYVITGYCIFVHILTKLKKYCIFRQIFLKKRSHSQYMIFLIKQNSRITIYSYDILIQLVLLSENFQIGDIY